CAVPPGCTTRSRSQTSRAWTRCSPRRALSSRSIPRASSWRRRRSLSARCSLSGLSAAASAQSCWRARKHASASQCAPASRASTSRPRCPPCCLPRGYRRARTRSLPPRRERRPAPSGRGALLGAAVRSGFDAVEQAPVAAQRRLRARQHPLAEQIAALVRRAAELLDHSRRLCGVLAIAGAVLAEVLDRRTVAPVPVVRAQSLELRLRHPRLGRLDRVQHREVLEHALSGGPRA